MIGVEPVLGGVKEVVGFPGVADAVCQYTGTEFSEDFEEADVSEVFNAG